MRYKSMCYIEYFTNLEPIDCTAVDERGEHTQAISEGISNWAHGQYYVKILPHALDEEVVHGERCCLHFSTLNTKKIKNV